jgi:uncharacterized protein YfdQ (DUF2303 family)
METDLKKIIAAAIAGTGGPRSPVFSHDDQEIPYAVIPDGYNLESLERFFPAPKRKTGHVTLNDMESFVSYSKRHGSLASCVIYGAADFELQTASLVAILNDHAEDDPAWRDHKATYIPIQTVEWKRWKKSNAQAMTQEGFAQFLEENLGDIAATEDMPTGTDILNMALEFEATSDKRFKSRLNLQGGGVNLLFVDQDNPDTEQRMKFYERFSLGLRVFLNGQPYRLDARLKYRQNNGKLQFWYELIRPDRVFQDAVQTEFNAIKEKTGFPLLFGSP